jgi:hypothetical protein
MEMSTDSPYWRNSQGGLVLSLPTIEQTHKHILPLREQMKKIGIMFFCILLTGCATRPVHPIVKIMNDFANGCYADIEKQPETKIVREQIIPNQNLPPSQMYDFLNSTSKVAPNQKRALGIYVMMDIDCDKAFEVALSGTPFQKPRIEFNNQLHPLYKKLLDGDISIGEFNTRLKALFVQFDAGQRIAIQEVQMNAFYAQQLFNPYGSGNIFIYQGR